VVPTSEESTPHSVLAEIIWQPGRATIRDVTFLLETPGASAVPSGGSHELCLYKTKGFLNFYERFLDTHRSFSPHRILELGIWGGGSIALWNEVFSPDRMVGLDIRDRPKESALLDYIQARSLTEAITLHWGVSQDDAGILGKIVDEDFTGHPPDLVIDDASHAYGPTKASFEALFPRMGRGSIYVIEDWASSYPAGDSSGGPPLHSLVGDLVRTLGSTTSPIAAIEVYRGIVVVKRNGRDVSAHEFRLASRGETTASSQRRRTSRRVAGAARLRRR